jgi:putative transposase
VKKHSTRAIAAKLDRARDLAANGAYQADICKDLGISVMTLHRWRKQFLPHGYSRPAEKPDAALIAENERLRQAAVDILLETLELRRPGHRA